MPSIPKVTSIIMEDTFYKFIYLHLTDDPRSSQKNVVEIFIWYVLSEELVKKGLTYFV